MNTEIPYLGFCSSCKTGTLGVRICGACDQPCVMCDECEAIWLGPKIDVPPSFPEQPEVPCPRCGASLLSRQSHWADRARLTKLGWDLHIVGNGTPLGGRRAMDDETED